MDILRKTSKDTITQLAFALAKITATILPQRCVLCADICDTGCCLNCIKLLPWSGLCCRCCGKTITHVGVCGTCQNHKPVIQSTLAPFLYAPPISGFIQNLKYSGQLYMASALGRIVAQHIIASAAPRPQVLLPVPLHRTRLGERGFNQSYELARVIARQIKIPIAADAVIRTRYTQSQTELSRTQRPKNVRGAFALQKPIAADSVAIIDDVITTGSTIQEVARVLQRSGVKHLSVWAVAKT